MKDIMQKIIAIEKEEERRKHLDINKYNSTKKIHLKQIEFHKCKKRNRWVFGGNRSGKTECGAVETVWWARGIHPYRENRKDTSGWVVSLSQQVQRDVAQKKVLQYLDKSWIKEISMLSGSKGSCEYGIIDFIIIENIFGGKSKIGFKSCEAGREKFQGTSLDYVWFDEEPPKDIYDECLMRILDREGDIWGTMTPLKGLTWVYDEIYLNSRNNPNIWSIFMEWSDNPYLAAEEILLMNNSLSADALESRRYGRFCTSFGLVYSEFQPETHVIEPFDVPFEWYDNISIDPGLNNPLSCHFYACDYDGNVYVIAEHFEANKDVVYHAEKIKEIANLLNWKKDRFNRISALIDSAANQKTLASCKSVTELFIEQGINVNPKVNKELFSGINRVKNYLKVIDGKPRLYIFKNCTNMIRELKSYWWGDNDRPKKQDDHCLDELRYYISSRPEAPIMKINQSVIERDKANLYSKIKRQR